MLCLAFNAPPYLLAQAQAARRVPQGADAEAASVPGRANGSALGVVSPRGGGHNPQNTPEFLAMLYSNDLFEPEVAACLCGFVSSLITAAHFADPVQHACWHVIMLFVRAH